MNGRVFPAGASGLALDRSLSRFAVVLRAGGVVAAVIASVVSEAAGTSRSWQLLSLSGLAAWALVFTAVAVRRGLSAFLVAADVVVVALVLLEQAEFIPASAAADGTTWAIMLASTSVYISLLAVRPIAGLPLVAVIIIAYTVGTPKVTIQISVLALQAVMVGAVVELLRHAGHRADAILADTYADRQKAAVDAARRADEHEQFARMHDSVLSTLTMIALGGIGRDSANLLPAVEHGLRVLSGLDAALSEDDSTLVGLAEQLKRIAADAVPGLAVDMKVAEILLPVRTATVLAEAAGEALRNAEMYAAAARVQVRAEECNGLITVEVIDDGIGFDPAQIPVSRLGVRRSIVARLEMIGGTATVESRPGFGTHVSLRWPRA